MFKVAFEQAQWFDGYGKFHECALVYLLLNRVAKVNFWFWSLFDTGVISVFRRIRHIGSNRI